MKFDKGPKFCCRDDRVGGEGSRMILFLHTIPFFMGLHLAGNAVLLGELTSWAVHA